MLRRICSILLVAAALGLPSGAYTGLVATVRASFASGSDAAAIQLLRDYRKTQGTTAEYLEALSWLARAELSSRNYTAAEQYAQETYAQAGELLKKRKLDADQSLPLAVGAAIEVQGNLLAATGRRSEAVTYLNEQIRKFGATSIVTRTQKNLLLLTLEGKPAPALEGLAIPKGKPALVFFWAHWCPDCKAEAPILQKILAEYGPQGLTLLAPTQKYGYVAGGVDAVPAVERAYIEQVRQRYYNGVIPAPIAVSEKNFVSYGASTTPTLVLVDRAGIVRAYHPGAMKYEELRDAVAKVIAAK
jgi:thiol-disulfide isomerase/thioredoxin